MTPRVSALFALCLFISQPTFINAAPFARIFQSRDAGDFSTAGFAKQNAVQAQQLNVQFASLTVSDPCQEGNIACVNNSFAQCSDGKWELTPCSTGLTCYALPLANSPGTSIVCDTEQDALARISASGATGGLTGKNTTTEGAVTIASSSISASSTTILVSSSVGASSTVVSITPTGSSTIMNATNTPTGSSTITSGTNMPTGTTGTNNTTNGQASDNDPDNDNGDDCTDDGDTTESSIPNRNSTLANGNNGYPTSGVRVQGGNSTNSSTSANSDNDCDENDGAADTDTAGDETDCDEDEGGNSAGDMGPHDGTTSSAVIPTSTANVSQGASIGSRYLYRRQYGITFSDGTFSDNTSPTQLTPSSTPSSNLFPSPSQSDNASSPLNVPSGTPTSITASSLSTDATTPAVPTATTVTLMFVSTVTVTVPSSSCHATSVGTGFPDTSGFASPSSVSSAAGSNPTSLATTNSFSQALSTSIMPSNPSTTPVVSSSSTTPFGTSGTTTSPSMSPTGLTSSDTPFGSGGISFNT
ncbi:hypothetical protein AX15_002267 [Amanita polypyramis BW_CC]|nr:hypothetical protein AX15_002267 [Amanita polypyramis BW_CC]